MSAEVSHDARFAILIEGADAETRERLTRRFDKEFGLDESIAPLERLGQTWLPLRARHPAGRLPDMMAHLGRVEALYRGEGGAALALSMVYVDGRRAVLGTRAESPHRLPLGPGVWAEVVLTGGESGGWRRAPVAESLWDDPEIQKFLDHLLENRV